MPSILIVGSGHIGSAIGQLLSTMDNDYQVILADIMPHQPNDLVLNSNLRYVSLDAQNPSQMAKVIKTHKIEAVLSSLPYFVNLAVAKFAREAGLHYFDLTEDVATTTAIAKLAKGAKTAFIPQCGVAPGFINIVANELMQHFEQLDTVKLRCGALPEQASNALQYALTWSIDGLINEYGNPCHAIAQGKTVQLNPLTDLEELHIDGARYEAFNTSGGLGSLLDVYAGKVQTLNYKTLRFPGHCALMRFLMDDLQLNQHRDNLKEMLLRVIPYTHQDMVLVYVSVQGYQDGQLRQETYSHKFYPAHIADQDFTAIQMATASSACAVMDLVLKNPRKYKGFIHQSQFDFNEFLHNRFAQYFHLSHAECEHE